MKTMSLAFVLALSLIGCQKNGPDCGKAIDHSMELSKDMMQKMGVDAAMMQKMKDVGLQHCKADKWAPEVVQCMIDAKTMQDGQACYGKLSQEQQDKMNKAAMALQSAGSASTGSANAGSASAGSATGSDTGSAPAGSATTP